MTSRRFHTSTGIALFRTLLFCVNIIFMISGVLLVLIGLIIQTQLKDLLKISPEMNSASPYVVIVLGLVIFFIGLFAFWCTAKGQIVLLYVYSVIIALILFMEILLAITILMKKRTFEETFKTTLGKMMERYPQKPMNSYMDRLQKSLSCCGITSYNDWFETHYGRLHEQVPESCCRKSLNHTCIRTNLNKENLPFDINKTGCYQAVITVIKNNYPVFGGIILIIASFPLCGIILACCLANQMRKNRYEQVE